MRRPCRTLSQILQILLQDCLAGINIPAVLHQKVDGDLHPLEFLVGRVIMRS